MSILALAITVFRALRLVRSGVLLGSFRADATSLPASLTPRAEVRESCSPAS